MKRCDWGPCARVAIGLTLLVAATAAPASAQYTLAWFAIAGGGTTQAAGGSYTVSATIGQATTGQLTGGGYTLGGGFWRGVGGAVMAVSPDGPEPASAVPLVFRLHPSAPNPYRAGRMRVAFDLPRAGWARILVYDVAGRLTRTLWDGELPAGRHQLAWDGTDDHGQKVAQGVYFLRLDQRDEIERQKLVIAR